MKKTLILILILLTISIKAQSDSVYKKHRHELGADITGLLSQFFNFSNSNNYYFPTPTYLVTYRLYVKKSNIRFGIGGYYSKTSVPGYTINGQEKTFYNTNTQFSLRLGYEFVSELSKRWQAFYGLDFRPSINNGKSEASFSNGGYLNGNIDKTTVYGIAPLFGFRFRLTDRVSITTETSFSYYIQDNSRQTTYIPLDNNLYPAIPNSPIRKIKTVGASFSQPLFLILTMNL